MMMSANRNADPWSGSTNPSTPPRGVCPSPRETGPPPAPVRVSKFAMAQTSPNEVSSPLSGWGVLPRSTNAPKKPARNIVSMAHQPLPILCNLASILANQYLDAYYELKSKNDDPEDDIQCEALAEACTITPGALPSRFKSTISEAFGATTFIVDEFDVMIEHLHNMEGRLTRLKLTLWDRAFVHSIEADKGESSKKRKSRGHWEEIGTGKGGKARFWVEADAMN